MGVWEVFFSISEEIVYSSNYLFDIFSSSLYLTYVPQFSSENLVKSYLFTSQGVSLCSRFRFFIIPALILSQLELLKIELPKLPPSVLMGNCDHFICPFRSTLFLYASARRTWLCLS